MADQVQEAYIVAALRTPVAKVHGAFANTRPDDLLSFIIKEAVASVPEIASDGIEDVIIGCAMPEGAQGMNVARISTLLAGLSDKTPALTINRFCGHLYPTY